VRTVADVPRSYPPGERRLIEALAGQDPGIGPELVHQLGRLEVLPVDPATGDFDVAACAPIITAARRARAAGMPWPTVPAALFGQQCSVPREALLAAYHALFEAMTEDVPSEVRRDVADYVTQRNLPRTKRSKLGREWIARSGEYGARRGGKVEAGSLGLYTLVLGPPDDAVHVDRVPLAQISGIGEEIQDTVIDVIQLVSNRGVILECLDSSSIEELELARTLLYQYAGHLPLLTDPVIIADNPGLTGSTLTGIYEAAILLPVFNVLRREFPIIAENIDADSMG
jgi:hypothetical protein